MAIVEVSFVLKGAGKPQKLQDVELRQAIEMARRFAEKTGRTTLRRVVRFNVPQEKKAWARHGRRYDDIWYFEAGAFVQRRSHSEW